MKALLVALLLLPTLATAKLKPGVVYTTDEKLVNAPVDCGKQEFNWFSLQPSANLPTPPELPGDGFNYNLIAPGEAHRLRLDVCLDPASGKMTLKRLLVLDERTATLLVNVPASAEVRGLTEALTDQNYDPLRVEIALEDDVHYLIEGRRSPKGAYVTGVRTYLQDGKWTPASIAFFSGEFAYGNAFVAGRCPLGQDFQTSHFKFGTARFTAEYCAYQGVGETTDYDFVGLSVTDSNSQLGAEAGKTVAFKSADELKPVLVYKHNHHDACDSFHLTLPHAEYAATTAPVAGCGVPVPGAPDRKIDDTEHGVRYRLRYGAGAWTEGLMKECGHYLFGCNVDGAQSASAEVAEAVPPAYLSELSDRAQFNQLAHAEGGLTYVKYSLLYADEAIYFQDTNRFPFHFPFLKSEIPGFSGLAESAYDDLLFTPGKKVLSAGALYYDPALRVPEYGADGLLGFVVYFHDTIDKDEVARVYRKLQQAAPFAEGRIAFAFERRADYFKFKSKLWPVSCNTHLEPGGCIPSLPLDRFKR